MRAAADKGLLLTLLELARRAGEPTTSAAIAEATGIPEQYAHIIEQRLEENRQRGLVERRPDGRWQATLAGIRAATARADGIGDRASARPEEAVPRLLRDDDGILPGVPLN